MCHPNEHHHYHCHAPPYTRHIHPRFCCMPLYLSVEEEVRMLERAKEALETRLKYINERLERLKAGRQSS
ncbi:MAG: hypothetical protein QW638_02865 [Candidatus Bathyarchaeia archaeon]|nr:hypothetical protein [Candidatus Bathyarchaeota archaeon]